MDRASVSLLLSFENSIFPLSHSFSYTVIFKCHINPWPHFNCHKNDYNEFCGARHTDLICEKKRALVSDWYSVWAATLRSELVFREKSLCSCSQSFSQGTQMCRYDVQNHFERIILPWHVLNCMPTLHWNMHEHLNTKWTDGASVFCAIVPIL